MGSYNSREPKVAYLNINSQLFALVPQSGHFFPSNSPGLPVLYSMLKNRERDTKRQTTLEELSPGEEELAKRESLLAVCAFVWTGSRRYKNFEERTSRTKKATPPTNAALSLWTDFTDPTPAFSASPGLWGTHYWKECGWLSVTPEADQCAVVECYFDNFVAHNNFSESIFRCACALAFDTAQKDVTSLRNAFGATEHFKFELRFKDVWNGMPVLLELMWFLQEMRISVPQIEFEIGHGVTGDPIQFATLHGKDAFVDVITAFAKGVRVLDPRLELGQNQIWSDPTKAMESGVICNARHSQLILGTDVRHSLPDRNNEFPECLRKLVHDKKLADNKGKRHHHHQNSQDSGSATKEISSPVAPSPKLEPVRFESNVQPTVQNGTEVVEQPGKPFWTTNWCFFLCVLVMILLFKPEWFRMWW